jgi:DNA-directed RNA polymerase specialized sigma24 family protein
VSYHPDNDALLSYARAAQHGDDVALGHLVRATQGVIWRFCSNLSSRQEADDLTQEVYIRAVRNLGQYRGTLQSSRGCSRSLAMSARTRFARTNAGAAWPHVCVESDR